jgi:hypothetical protein
MINFSIENDMQFKQNQIEKLNNELKEMKQLQSKMNEIKSMPQSDLVF